MGGRLRGHDVGGEVDVCAPSAGCQDDVGGAAAVAQGGSFLHGFAANAIGAAAGVVSDAVSMGNDILDTAIVAAAGCAGAVFSGGKCANGAVTAAFANMYNKLMHRQGPVQYPEGHQCRTNPSYCGGAATESIGPVEFIGGVRAVLGLACMAGRGIATGFSAVFRGFCSFDEATLVRTKSGLVPIKDIEPGKHLVWSRNEETGKAGWKPVTARWVNPHADRIILTIAHNDNDATGTQTLITTREHPFFVKGAERSVTLLVAANENPAGYIGEIASGGAFITADRLEVGDRLMTADGATARLVSVAIEDTPLDAYNLTVADFHTFYVRGGDDDGDGGVSPGVAANDDAPAVWVHNCDSLSSRVREGGGIPIHTKDTLSSVVDGMEENIRRQFQRNDLNRAGDIGNKMGSLIDNLDRFKAVTPDVRNQFKGRIDDVLNGRRQ